jgi:hypothetical protein
MSAINFERALENFNYALDENSKDEPNLIKEKAELYQGLSHLAMGMIDIVETLDKIKKGS